jgi:ubiquinone/menaquinone biosynthesis C-methylase UbiE
MKDILVKIWKNLHKKPKRYDFIVEKFFGATKIEIKTLLQYVDFKDKVVLDIGAGTGRLTIPISTSAKKIYAIEPEKETFDYLKEKIKKAHIKNIEIKKASAEKIPYPNNFFDAIICAWILPYIDLEKSLDEIKRVLKKEGYLLVIDHYGKDDWEKLAVIENPKYIKRYEKRNKKILKLIKDFQEIKTKIVDSFIKFPSLEIAKEVINEVRGSKASEYIEKNKILKILNKIFFICARK